ncbi:DUF3159 domain-containing protein [Microbacterium istanbulense]|uniref:DUF3159 domain-containing protein n=1 Tax=Microbacterium istanbulense TaxID=3122049 RepID=A0ABU8LMX3_9MICO
MTDAEREPEKPAPADADQRSASEILGDAVGSAARRAGIDPESEASTGHVVWRVIGGWRGIAESVLPLLAFIVTYTATSNLVLALSISVGAAAVFTVIRLLGRSTPIAALSGLFAAVIAAGLPLFTGNAADQFVVGFITNIAYGSAFLLSVLVRWPLIGVVVGFLKNEGVTWRTDRRKMRVFSALTIVWALLFLARLGAQLPFYFAGDVATLGTVKIVMGIPLFAAVLALTFFAVTRLYARASESDGSAEA